MMRMLRRLVLATALVGVIAVVVRRRREHLPPGSGSPPASSGWPPIVADEDEPRAANDAPGEQAWVAPVDGACPDGFPIKANGNSGIFHVPGGRFYDRTIPERCYATTQAAEADGYRAAKA
ncbi:MAG: hypothetical protein HZB15_03745 [Actinobacteria bacterium]|nr:hypothetical protein [Actinomycetota bacterium]